MAIRSVGQDLTLNYWKKLTRSKIFYSSNESVRQSMIVTFILDEILLNYNYYSLFIACCYACEVAKLHFDVEICLQNPKSSPVVSSFAFVIND